MIALRGTGQLIPLLGNHEVMMLESHGGLFDDFPSWLTCGGKETLASYGADNPTREDLDRVPPEHWFFLENDCRRFYESETHFFVHANAYPDVELAEQPDYVLFWEKFNDPAPHCSGKIMVCGHTRQRSGVPCDLGHAVCIDTGVYAGGWLTCLDCATGDYWQTNEKGEVRTAKLGKA